MTELAENPAKSQSPFAHLSEDDIERFGAELDAIRQEVLDSRGESDARYIRRVIGAQRRLEISSRVALLASAGGIWGLPIAALGAIGLGISKILENMEIGHNILHGQWDWMRDPRIHSTVWDWDAAMTAEDWKHQHNEVHHTYTNIIGKDDDLGYSILRVDEAQPWKPSVLWQPAVNFLTMLVFEYGIAAHDIGLGRNMRLPKDQREPGFNAALRRTLRKTGGQLRKDYLLNPAAAGLLSLAFVPLLGWWNVLFAVLLTAGGNLIGNLMRNVWSHSVIICGHFPEGVAAFQLDELPEVETKGYWYLRQMLGSANISGSRTLHLMTGNLSHQIEHHLFPDLPSNRYWHIAPKVRAVCERYGLSYNARPLIPQVYSAWHKVMRLTFPNGWWERKSPRELWRAIREYRADARATAASMPASSEAATAR